jgi:hypothetical protein
LQAVDQFLQFNLGFFPDGFHLIDYRQKLLPQCPIDDEHNDKKHQDTDKYQPPNATYPG